MSQLWVDCRYGFDPRAIHALLKLGVFPGTLEASSEGPLRWKLTFQFSGDRELAKYHLSTFIADEYNGTNVLFYASAANPQRCYCYFTVREERAISREEVETNNRRSDRQRKASDHPSGE